MQIALIETFLSVVSNQNITQAANQLFVSQSTVSSRISQLEKELGVELFSRSKGARSIELTEHGTAFIPVAEKYLSVDREIAQFTAQDHSFSLTIAIPDSLNMLLFSPLYIKMMKSEPLFHLNISTHQSPEIYEIVNNHDADLGFVFYPYHYPNIITRPLFKEKMYIITSKTLYMENEDLHPSDLSVSDELFFAWNGEISHWHDYWWQSSSAALAQVDTVGLLIELIKSYPSWALCPESVISIFKDRDVFTVHSCLESIPPRTTYMLFRRDSEKSIKKQRFEMFLHEYLRSCGLCE